MNNSRRNLLIRSAVYLYFALGMALLLSAGAASIVRFTPENGFALGWLFVVTAAIFAVLAVSSWDRYARPLRSRKWLILCALASIGFVNVMLMTRLYTASGA